MVMNNPGYGQGQPYQPPYQPQPQGAPGYGQPPQQPLPPPVEIKWGGLSKGGSFKVPVISFIGRLVDMIPDSSAGFALRIVEKYDQVQILESPVAWPWPTLDLSIKYSDREESGWGRHVGSAKALGLAQNVSSMEQAKAELVGKVYQLRQKEEDYGEDRATGHKFHGDVWRFERVLTGTPQVAGQPAPVYIPPAPAPVYIPPPQVQQPANLPGAPPAVIAPGSTFDTKLAPTDTAPVRAKKLLDGRALNEFLGVVLVDSVAKADAGLINSIYDQSFVLGLRASGQVVMGPDGKFKVVA